MTTVKPSGARDMSEYFVILMTENVHSQSVKWQTERSESGSESESESESESGSESFGSLAHTTRSPRVWKARPHGTLSLGQGFLLNERFGCIISHMVMTEPDQKAT